MRTAHNHLSILTDSGMSLSFVEEVHGSLNSDGAKVLDDLYAGVDLLRQLLFFFGRPFIQHIVHLESRMKVVSDSKTQPGIIISSQHFGNISQSVMSSVTPPGFHPERPKRKSQVIDQNQ